MSSPVAPKHRWPSREIEIMSAANDTLDGIFRRHETEFSTIWRLCVPNRACARHLMY